MEALRITLFGHVTVVRTATTMPLKLPQSSQAFFAYLLLQKHLIPREVLMEVFWGEYAPNRAHSSLTTAVWRLRHLLEPSGITPGSYLITKKSGEVGFNWESPHWLDCASFEQPICPLLRKASVQLTDAEVKQIEETLALYRGDLLESIYADWALRERERFRTLHLNCLTRLMHYYADHQNFAQSIAFGHEILRRDPLREEIHRALIQLYLASGEQTLALRQYEACREGLRRELDVAPLAETQCLYRQILAGSPANGATIGSGPNLEMADLLRELHTVQQQLAELTKAVAHITQVANRLAGSGDNPVTAQ